MNVRKLFDSSVAYFEGEHADASGNILARQFPTTVAWSPSSATACCSATGGKCTPASSYWTSPTFVALNFSVDDPFYFSYQYTSGGSDATSTFNAEARGNLNCDSATSLFRRSGSVTSDNNVTGGAGLYTVNEIE